MWSGVVIRAVSVAGPAEGDAVSQHVRSEHGEDPDPALAPESRGAGAGPHPPPASGQQRGSAGHLRER